MNVVTTRARANLSLMTLWNFRLTAFVMSAFTGPRHADTVRRLSARMSMNRVNGRS